MRNNSSTDTFPIGGLIGVLNQKTVAVSLKEILLYLVFLFANAN